MGKKFAEPGSDNATALQKARTAMPDGYKKPIDRGERYPEHFRNIAFLLKNNSEIRRFTSLQILNYLEQEGEIQGVKRYVEFLWNKFRVKVDGLTREYFYTETFFLNALVASFASFSATAQTAIDKFCHKEMSMSVAKICDPEIIEEIVTSNLKRSDDFNEEVAMDPIPTKSNSTNKK